MTLLLNRSAILRHLDVRAALTAQATGLRAPTAASQRVVARLAAGSATALLPGLLEGIPAYTVKVNAKFPGAHPSLRGVVCLHALGDGELLALLDSATITAWRTGLAAAAATDALVAPEADSVGIIGAGAQAEITLRGIAALRPLRTVTIADPDPAAAAALAAVTEQVSGAETIVTENPAVAGCCTILITATWSRRPVIRHDQVSPECQQITALGFDEPGKRELPAQTLEAAQLVVDDVGLAKAVGVLSGARTLRAQTISQVMSNRTCAGAGRMVYAPVGMPWQDLALAWPVYRAARDGGVAEVDLLA